MRFFCGRIILAVLARHQSTSYGSCGNGPQRRAPADLKEHCNTTVLTWRSLPLPVVALSVAALPVAALNVATLNVALLRAWPCPGCRDTFIARGAARRAGRPCPGRCGASVVALPVAPLPVASLVVAPLAVAPLAVDDEVEGGWLAASGGRGVEGSLCSHRLHCCRRRRRCRRRLPPAVAAVAAAEEIGPAGDARPGRAGRRGCLPHQGPH